MLSQSQRRDIAVAVKQFAEVWMESNSYHRREDDPHGQEGPNVTRESVPLDASSRSRTTAPTTIQGSLGSQATTVLGVSCLSDLRQVLFEALGGNLIDAESDTELEEEGTVGKDSLEADESETSTQHLDVHSKAPSTVDVASTGRSGSKRGGKRVSTVTIEDTAAGGAILKPRPLPTSSFGPRGYASSAVSRTSSAFRSNAVSSAARDATELAQREQEEEERMIYLNALPKEEQEAFLHGLESLIDDLLKKLLYFEAEDPYPRWYSKTQERLKGIAEMTEKQQIGIKSRMETCPLNEPVLSIDDWLICLDPRQNKGGGDSPAGKIAFSRLRHRFSRVQLEKISHWLLEILFDHTTTVHWIPMFKARCCQVEALPECVVDELIFFLSKIIPPRAFKADCLLPLVEVGKLKGLSQPDALIIDVKRMCSMLSEAQSAMLVVVLQNAEAHLRRLSPKVDDFMSASHLSEIDKLSAAFSSLCPHNQWLRKLIILCFPEHLESHQIEISKILQHHIIAGSPQQQGISGEKVKLESRLKLWHEHMAYYCGANLFSQGQADRTTKVSAHKKQSNPDVADELSGCNVPPRATYRRVLDRRTLAFRSAVTCAECLSRDLLSQLTHQLGLVALHGLEILGVESTKHGEVNHQSLGEMTFTAQVSSLVSAAHAIVRKAFPDAPESFIRVIRFLLLEGATFPNIPLSMDQIAAAVEEKATDRKSDQSVSQGELLRSIPVSFITKKGRGHNNANNKQQRNNPAGAFHLFTTVLKRAQMNGGADPAHCGDFIVSLCVNRTKHDQLKELLEALPRALEDLDRPKQSMTSVSVHGLDTALLNAAQHCATQWNLTEGEKQHLKKVSRREALPELRWTLLKAGQKTTSYGTPVPLFDISVPYKQFLTLLEKRGSSLTESSGVRHPIPTQTPFTLTMYFSVVSTSQEEIKPKLLSVEQQRKEQISEMQQQSRSSAGISGFDCAALPYSAAMLQYEFESYPRGQDGGIILSRVLETINEAAACQADPKLRKRLIKYVEDNASSSTVRLFDTEDEALISNGSPSPDRKVSQNTVSFETFSKMMLELARI